jgi:hypothetical protein
MGAEGRINLYPHVENDPGNLIDPSGTAPAQNTCSRVGGVACSGSYMTMGNQNKSAPPRPAPPTRYRITIYADEGGGGTESSSTKGLGHAWIGLERIRGGRVIHVTTRGLWPDRYAGNNGPGFDIRSDRELNRHADAAHSQFISASRYNDVLSYSGANMTYSEFNNNCVDFATFAWRLGTGQTIDAYSGWTLGYGTPAQLANQLRN